MKVGIYSLKKILFEGDALSVNCKTAAGEITILDHHRPLISMLSPGAVKITDALKKDHYLNVSAGFLEVNSDNRAKFIVDEA
jgi:F0F1-type ATP synthase epsilon subunit